MENDWIGHQKNMFDLQLILSSQSCVKHEHTNLAGVVDQNLGSVSDLTMVDKKGEFGHSLQDL